MPVKFVDITAPGIVSAWLVYGTTSPGWEAVLRTGDDTTYIGSQTAAQKSTFYCASIHRPVGGTIMALTLHYRIRRSTPSIGGSVNLIITQNGFERIVDTVSPVGTAWTDGVVRVREEWVTNQRFTSSDLRKMGLGVQINTVPSHGGFEISKLWLEIEYLDGPYRYDPFCGVVPNTIVGDLKWATMGGQPAVVFANYLEIRDIVPIDFRAYYFTDPHTATVREGYISEVETRSTVIAVDPSPSSADVCLLGIREKEFQITLNAFHVDGIQYLGLVDNLADPVVLNNYYAYAPFTYLGRDTHYRLKIRRYLHDPQKGRVQLFLDYDPTPIFDIPYSTIVGSTFASLRYEFSVSRSAFKTAQYKLDYYAWKLYKDGSNGLTNQNWTSFDQDANSIKLDESDPDINKLKRLSLAGVTSGQSNYACKFEVGDPTEDCRLSQVFADHEGAPTVYNLDVDYKDDLGAGFSGEIIVQRCSDLWYWDDVGKAWVAGFTSVTLPSSASRIKASAVVSGIINATPEDLLLTVNRNSGAIGPYNLWLYKVRLYE